MNPVNLNKTTIRAELTPEKTYTIKVTLNGVFDDSDAQHPRKNLRFEQGDGENRNITLWKDSTPREVYDHNFTQGITYIFTAIRYSLGGANDQYDNLTATYTTTVKNARAVEEEIDDDAETFAGGEPLDAHIDDGLSDAPVEEASAFENDSGHVMTSVASREPLPAFEVYPHILVATDENPESDYARKRLTHEARRELYAATNADVIAPDGTLQLVALSPLTDDALELEKVRVEVGEPRTLDYTNAGDRAVAKGLLEEAIKAELRGHYDVRGIDEVLSPEPVVESDAFSLHERYDLSIEVGHTGTIYLHVNFRHRQLSHLRLDRLDDDDIYPGLRVKTTYGDRSGYIVWGLSEKGPNDPLERLGNRSVVKYHKDAETVDKETLTAIKRENNCVVEAYRQGHGGDDKPAVLPQKLLVVQPRPGQVERFDREFANESRSKTRLSASRCTEKVSAFVEANNTCSFDNQTIAFETTLFAGDDNQHLVQLYDEYEEILTFADREHGSHPNETFERGIAVPPKTFNVTLVRPQQRTDDSDSGWDALSRILSDAGAEPNRIDTIEYDAFDNPQKISLDVGSEIDVDETDAALVVLPPDSGFAGVAASTEVYRECKKTLADAAIYSQMVNIDNFGHGQTFLTRNVALGLLAAAGGIPFTVEDVLPGDAEMFVGVDVSRRYPDDSSDAQINVAATTTAVYRDGTILGHSSTTPQLGEKLSGEDVRDIMKSSVLGFKKQHGDYPTRLVIHRDGFMREDLSLALDFLDALDIAYDIVEIRKQPQTRLLAVNEVQYSVPTKSVAVCNQNEPKATIATFGAPETLAESEYSGLPRPIQIERIAGETDIETLARQVYLLSQSHVGVHNSTARLPITTAFADKASSDATKGHLVQTGRFEPNLGFI